ncbi:protein DMP2-like [Carex rostrata]
MAGDQAESLTSSADKASSTTEKVTSSSFQGVGNLIKLLPSGTVFVFEFLNPLLTNYGSCTTLDKYLTGALLVLCGFSCCFSSFTDSIEENDKVYYGLATRKGMWLFSGSTSTNLSKYKLRFADFVHAAFSLLVFIVVALLNSDTVSCYYPSLKSNQKNVLMALPVVVGCVASTVFAAFPSNRHGIGYPRSTKTETSSE